jgi:hypothetical protein
LEEKVAAPFQKGIIQDLLYKLPAMEPTEASKPKLVNKFI